jgi:hypothetical protein
MSSPPPYLFCVVVSFWAPRCMGMGGSKIPKAPIQKTKIYRNSQKKAPTQLRQCGAVRVRGLGPAA